MASRIPRQAVSTTALPTISADRARRLALGAQGFAQAKPTIVGTRQLNGLIDRLGLLQIDSVNVFERSHYLPVFARLGAYDKTLLDRLTFGTVGQKARYFEYWGHAATILPIEALPALRWRMQHYRQTDTQGWKGWPEAHAPMIEWVKAELADKGPMAASEIEHEENTRKGPWWGWSEVKAALEVLFRRGEVFSAGRRRFERRYGLAEHALPAGALDVELPKDEAIRSLVRQSVRALGIGTLSDIADYFRLRTDDTKAALRDLVDAGEVTEVAVRGWKSSAYLEPSATVPRRIETAALLSPFDPIVWERDRARRIFDFDYTIEIYTPAPKRLFGYYTLPVLVDDRLVGRIDLKSDRQRRVLMVQSAWREPHAPAGIEERIAPLLRDTAAWQGLESIEVAERGDLSAALAGALGVRAGA